MSKNITRNENDPTNSLKNLRKKSDPKFGQYRAKNNRKPEKFRTSSLDYEFPKHSGKQMRKPKR
jgi:hypothetical protein